LGRTRLRSRNSLPGYPHLHAEVAVQIALQKPVAAVLGFGHRQKPTGPPHGLGTTTLSPKAPVARRSSTGLEISRTLRLIAGDGPVLPCQTLLQWYNTVHYATAGIGFMALRLFTRALLRHFTRSARRHCKGSYFSPIRIRFQRRGSRDRAALALLPAWISQKGDQSHPKMVAICSLTAEPGGLKVIDTFVLP